MKTLFDICKTTFLIIGAIIGVGFITGAELVGFFGVENFFSNVILATVFLALALAFSFSRFTGKNGIKVLTNGNKFYRASILFSSLIFSASMLAGIDSLLNTVIDLKSFQIGSIVAIILISIFSKFGVNGMEKLNLFLMPIVIITVNILIFTRQEIVVEKLKSVTFGGGIKALLYVFMNVFISIPIMVETVKNKSKKSLFVVSVLVAFVIGTEAFIILSAIKNSTINMNGDMPLYVALFSGNFSCVYFISMLACGLTSAFSAYYPLYVYAKEKSNVFGLTVCALLTVIVAKMGLSGIVSYAYPIVGGLGVLFFIKCISIKSKTYADNNSNCLKNGGSICQKRKRIKL